LSEVDETTRLLVMGRDGDRVALTAFVRRTQGEVWRLCAHLAGRDTADDLTQDVYARALGALPAFRAEASARTWLLAIAHRTCADAIRRRTRRRALVERITAHRRPSALAPDATDAVALEALLEVLDADQRSAFVLTQLLGLPYAEAAEVCGCPTGTIRSRVARARTALVDALHADPATGDVAP
jgi:RNA polymerase sigma-70 factor (ECF subfamily)